jgi:hypothetical protein
MQTVYNSQILLTEADGNGSRGVETIEHCAYSWLPPGGQAIVWPAGMVMGRITASGNMAPFDPRATDGLQTVAGILLATVDVTQRAVSAPVLKRNATIRAAALEWSPWATAYNTDGGFPEAGLTYAQLVTQGLAGLASLGIVPG